MFLDHYENIQEEALNSQNIEQNIEAIDNFWKNNKITAIYVI